MIKLLDNGWDNDVYLVDGYIFRCPRRKIAVTLIERENAALDLLKHKLNVEIPNIQYQFIGPAQYHYPFHGYKMLAGTPLYKACISAHDRVHNIQIFANFLKKLHAIPLHEVLNAGIGPQVFNRTDTKAIIVQMQKRMNKPMLSLKIKPYHHQMNMLCKKALFITLSQNDYVLVHGDLYAKHLLFNNKKLGGVIDWGDVGLNHFVIDLMALYSIFPKSCHQEFFKIYGEVKDEIKLFAKFLAVHSALACLDFADSANDAHLQTEAVQALSYIFDEAPFVK